MIVVKNTFGVSCSLNPKISNPSLIGTMGGSSLERKQSTKKEKDKSSIEEQLKKPLEASAKKEKKLRSMSKRTKSKIRKKLIAFARINKKLSFLTLTFVNKVEDEKAVEVLHAFLDNRSAVLDSRRTIELRGPARSIS